MSTLGPLMLDIAGTALTDEDRDLLRHPAVGGLILFSRNYASPEQLAELTGAIRALRDPPLLIGVDQEGGRVQRFRVGFSRLPPLGTIGRLYQEDAARGCEASRLLGWLMATELRAVGVDFSFAPVLDLDRQISSVIGDRSFGADPDQVSDLATAWVTGVRAAGMAAVGKHFPGHGGVAADSHAELPSDPRSLSALEAADLRPFVRLIQAGIEAIMPAHLVFPTVDSRPAGFSDFWLGRVLREQLGFTGLVFSDDLSMGGAAGIGSIEERVQAAAAAGCDMLLVCNDRAAASAAVEYVGRSTRPDAQQRFALMRGRRAHQGTEPHEPTEWAQARQYLDQLETLASLAPPRADPTDPETRT